MAGGESRHVYLTAAPVLLWMLFQVVTPRLLFGQDAGLANASDGASTTAATWRLFVDGQPTEWPEETPEAPADSLAAVAEALLQTLRGEGNYFARIDSAQVDTSVSPPLVNVFATDGPRVLVDTLVFDGLMGISEDDVRRVFSTKAGAALNPQRLQRDVGALLQLYEDTGRPLAQVRVRPQVDTTKGGSGLRVLVRVEEGASLRLTRIELPGSVRTTSGFVKNVTGLRTGDVLSGYDPQAIRQKLQDTGLYRSVAAPELRVQPNGNAVLRISATEKAPGAFDLVLGYLPPAGGRTGGQLVGNGSLELENPFGGGRTGALTLDRRPGQVSLFDVAVSDPYVLGLPLRIEGRFRGEQRDSTFSERAYRGAVGYAFDGGIRVQGSVSREVTRPGQEGTKLRGGRQQIPRADALFYGLGLQYQRVDRVENPRRGVMADVTLEQGRKDRRFRQVLGADTLRVNESLRQERIQASARVFLPLFSRQVVALGTDVSAVSSDEYDRSDLFFFGGAESLRGYDEDQFLGNVAGRFLTEYRLQIDPVSYAYVFADAGLVERPAIDGTPARSERLLGYGIGIQVGTALGLVDVTYALNRSTTSPADGRIHIGLRFGL